MPPEMKCPFCAEIVSDWHFEWHTQQDQRDIYDGISAMECPLCRAGVAFDGFAVSEASAGLVPAKRDVAKAAHWARNQNKSLRDYLKTQEGQAYVQFWTDDELDAADQQAASED